MGKIKVRQYAAAFVCLAASLVCVYAVPRLFQKNDLQAPDATPFTISGETTPVKGGVNASTGPAGIMSAAPGETIPAAPISATAGSAISGIPGETAPVSQSGSAPHVSEYSEQQPVPAGSGNHPLDSESADYDTISKLKSNYEFLNLDEAFADTDYGIYLPKNVPAGFSFESAIRFHDEERNCLSVLWTSGMDEIHWYVSKLEENDKARITTVADTKNYDLRLYLIPLAESVPDELYQIVDNPIFDIDDLTLEAVQARTYEVQDSGDVTGPRMNFSVLYGDTLVEISAKGATPEAIFNILRQINK